MSRIAASQKYLSNNRERQKIYSGVVKRAEERNKRPMAKFNYSMKKLWNAEKPEILKKSAKI